MAGLGNALGAFSPVSPPTAPCFRSRKPRGQAQSPVSVRQSGSWDQNPGLLGSGRALRPRGFSNSKSLLLWYLSPAVARLQKVCVAASFSPSPETPQWIYPHRIELLGGHLQQSTVSCPDAQGSVHGASRGLSIRASLPRLPFSSSPPRLQTQLLPGAHAFWSLLDDNTGSLPSIGISDWQIQPSSFKL